MEGAQGLPGAQGSQGLQGPAGAVLVIDGGVITGPPGSSVLVSTISAGGATCPTGGVRITQLSDGGLTNVCNGATGATGNAGAQGATGPAGAAGPSPTATVLTVMSPQCATGGVLINVPGSPSFPVCNGAQGPAGTQGATGLTGAAGSTGPAGAMGAPGVAGPMGATGVAGPAGATGPQGPAGAVLYLDGGVVVLSAARVQFAGFTTTNYAGNLGGYPGANQKCSAEFANSYLCTIPDYDQANTPLVPPAATGAWIDFARAASGARADNSCGSSGNSAWTWGSTGSYGANLNAVGGYYSTVNCASLKPLACCRGGTSSSIQFRGFTTATFPGDLGGYPGAAAKCQAQFAGSFLCTIADFDRANGTTVPPTSAGAWIDFDRTASGSRANNSCGTSGNTGWTSSSAGSYGANLNAVGGYYSTINCSVPKHLACCENR